MQRIVRHTSRLAILPFLLAALLLFSDPLTAQSSPETWMDYEKSPRVTAGKVMTEDEYRKVLQEQQSILSDLKCIKQTVNFSPTEHISLGMPFEGCWFSTSIGLIEKKAAMGFVLTAGM